MRLIIADDHLVVRDGLRWMLSERDDIEVVAEAQNGRELLEILGATEADVILLDVRMPEMSGLDALPEIRRLAPDTRVLILSMHDEPAYVRRAVELGASGYLLKSAGREELLRALEAIAAGSVYVQGEVTGPLLGAIGGPEGVERRFGLTPRELEVLALVAEGKENKQIARALEVSEATVKTHLKSVFERLDVRSRAEAVAVALRSGLID